MIGTLFRESLDGTRIARHPGYVGDKPDKYWDHNECRWVNSPAPIEPVSVPAQQDVESAEADDQTVMGAPI
jgi:hypothetical protein